MYRISLLPVRGQPKPKRTGPLTTALPAARNHTGSGAGRAAPSAATRPSAKRAPRDTSQAHFLHLPVTSPRALVSFRRRSASAIGRQMPPLRTSTLIHRLRVRFGPQPAKVPQAAHTRQIGYSPRASRLRSIFDASPTVARRRPPSGPWGLMGHGPERPRPTRRIRPLTASPPIPQLEQVAPGSAPSRYKSRTRRMPR